MVELPEAPARCERHSALQCREGQTKRRSYVESRAMREGPPRNSLAPGDSTPRLRSRGRKSWSAVGVSRRESSHRILRSSMSKWCQFSRKLRVMSWASHVRGMTCPYRAHLSAGCRDGLKSVGCHSCSGSSSCGMSATSQGCGMTGSVALVWDVARVQHKLLVGCHGRLTSVGCPRITPFYWRLRGLGSSMARGFSVARKRKARFDSDESRRILLSNVRNTA